MPEPAYVVTTTADVTPAGLIRLNEATGGRVVVCDGVAYFEIKDRNRARCNDLGRVLVRIRWDDLVSSVTEFLGSAVL